jgi:UPF0755 protein
MPYYYFPMLRNLKTLVSRIPFPSKCLPKKLRPLIYAAFTFLLLLLPLLTITHFLSSSAGHGEQVKLFRFSSGYTVKKISEDLERGRIISSSSLFSLYARFNGMDGKVKAGTYRFSDAMTPAEILRKLVSGDVDEVRFALPEGYSIYQVAELLDKRGIFKKDAFLEQCFNRSFLARLAINANSVEGFLYPSTYVVQPGMDEAALIKEMVSRFRSIYDKKFAERARSLGLNQTNVLTIASLIEKEAVNPLERPIIASVFLNRLRKGMPLQSDPTAVYGIRAFAGKISKNDILRDTPYNTYRIKGLPPGPIGNPGEASIEAALAPARTKYIYFVSKMDGTHHFSENLQQHNNAIQRYLKTNESFKDISMSSVRSKAGKGLNKEPL